MIAANCDISYEGLVAYHVYTVLGAVELMKDGAVYEKLVKLRNPWATEVYTGPWSDSDPQWTEDFKAQVNHTVANDGVFYMTLSDIFKGFYSVDIVHYKDSWIKQQKKFVDNHDKSTYSWTITNPVAQELVVGIDMLQNRKVMKTTECKDAYTK